MVFRSPINFSQKINSVRSKSWVLERFEINVLRITLVIGVRPTRPFGRKKHIPKEKLGLTGGPHNFWGPHLAPLGNLIFGQKLNFPGGPNEGPKSYVVHQLAPIFLLEYVFSSQKAV